MQNGVLQKIVTGLWLPTVLALMFSAGLWASRAIAQTNAGPFTDAQAQAGRSLFNFRCASCHGARSDATMRMTGQSFSNVWAAGTTLDLFTVIKTKMPPDTPGVLRDGGAALLVAYILSANGVAPGTTAFTPTTKVTIAAIISGMAIPKECVSANLPGPAPVADTPTPPANNPAAPNPQAVESQASLALSYIACAEAYARQGLLDQVIDFFNNAVKTDPGFATYYQRGFFYYSQGLGDQAIPDFTQAISLYRSAPTSAQATKKPASVPIPASSADVANAYFLRGISHQRENDYDEALPDYSRAISLQPDFIDAYENRAEVYSHDAQYELAIADYAQVIAHRPSFTYYYNRAFAYEGNGSPDQAIADLNKVISLAPDFAYGFSERGKLREKTGLKAEAVADYRAALKLNPAIQDAKDGLTRLGSSLR